MNANPVFLGLVVAYFAVIVGISVWSGFKT